MNRLNVICYVCYKRIKFIKEFLFNKFLDYNELKIKYE